MELSSEAVSLSSTSSFATAKSNASYEIDLSSSQTSLSPSSLVISEFSLSEDSSIAMSSTGHDVSSLTSDANSSCNISVSSENE
jgi:hypothetical protein